MTIADRLFYLNANAIKTPCRAATIANIALAGLQSIDGVALASGDRVLVIEQSNTGSNGIYVAGPDNWVRALDLTREEDIVEGTLVLVVEGTIYGDTLFILEPV